jgi:hypothetical protein
MNQLVHTIQDLEQGALEINKKQCNKLCFLENCSQCATGMLYQAAMLRHHVQRIQPGYKLPPIPTRLYRNTIKFLEQDSHLQ